MNIDRVNQNAASGAYGKRTNRAGDVGAAAGAGPTSGARGASPPADGVQLSDEARAIARAETAARAAPEVREDLIADLKQRIQSGTYKIQDEQIARRLLDKQA